MSMGYFDYVEDASIEFLGLTTRTRNVLKRAKIYTIMPILKSRGEVFTKLDGVGIVTYNEIKYALVARGYLKENTWPKFKKPVPGSVLNFKRVEFASGDGSMDDVKIEEDHKVYPETPEEETTTKVSLKLTVTDRLTGQTYNDPALELPVTFDEFIIAFLVWKRQLEKPLVVADILKRAMV